MASPLPLVTRYMSLYCPLVKVAVTLAARQSSGVSLFDEDET